VTFVDNFGHLQPRLDLSQIAAIYPDTLDLGSHAEEKKNFLMLAMEHRTANP
jgi:hypothetical protein